MGVTSAGNNPGHVTDNSSRSQLPDSNQGVPQERVNVQKHSVSQLPSVTSTSGDRLTAVVHPQPIVQEQTELQTTTEEENTRSSSNKSQNISVVKNRSKQFPDPTGSQLGSRRSGLLTGSTDVQNDTIVHSLIDKGPLRQNSNEQDDSIEFQKLVESKADSPKDGANASGYNSESELEIKFLSRFVTF